MNVNLWFARDDNGEIISVIDSNESNTYVCPICNSDVIPKALTSVKVSPHFAHIDKTKCDSESMLHFWFKHKFIERGDTFTIKTDKEYTFTCKDYSVEKQFKLEYGIYRPDLIVTTECGNEIVFEMANTNKKKVQDYIDRWIELDKIIVEVDIKSLQGNEKVFNALYYNGKCFNFNKRDGGYYNTYLTLKSIKSNRSINGIKNLEWFWREINEATVPNQEMYEIFDTFTRNEKEIFIKSSHKPTKEFIRNLESYKRNIIINKYKYLEGFIDFYRTNRSMSIYGEGNEYCAIIKTSLNLHYDSLDEIEKKIKRCMNVLDMYKKYEIYNRVNNCKNLTLAIKELNTYLQNNIDSGYELILEGLSNYRQKVRLVLKFKKYVVFCMNVNLKLLKLSDKDKMFKYLLKKATRHISTKFNKNDQLTTYELLHNINKFLSDNLNLEFNLKRSKSNEMKLRLFSNNEQIYIVNLKYLNKDILLEKLRKVIIKENIHCVRCGKAIQFSDKFIYKLIENNYKIPKRCGKCKMKQGEM